VILNDSGDVGAYVLLTHAKADDFIGKGFDVVLEIGAAFLRADFAGRLGKRDLVSFRGRIPSQDQPTLRTYYFEYEVQYGDAERCVTKAP
jgi:hypothetical protein